MRKISGNAPLVSSPLFCSRATRKNCAAVARGKFMAGYVCLQCGRLCVSAAKASYGVSFTRSLPFSAHLPHLRVTKEEIELLPVLKHGGASRKMIISNPQQEMQYEGFKPVLLSWKYLISGIIV